MIRQMWAIASTEALLARRTWRFWLMVALLVGILYLAWKDHVACMEADMFLAPDHSFGSRSYEEIADIKRPWIKREVPNHAAEISILVIWIGGVALALDCCGRLARTGMDKILFPRPFSTMALVVGRYLGLLLVMIPLSAIPWVGFGLFQSVYGHADVVWQPFVICYLFLVIPVLVPLMALAMWVRLVFKHDVAAVIAIGLMILVYRLPGREVMQVLGNNWRALQASSPSLGASIELVDQVPMILVHLALTAAFLLFGPFHLRRREPQRRILRRRGYRWFNIPTFLRWLSDLKIDRNLPPVLKLAAILSLVLVGGGGVFAVWDGRRESVMARESGDRIESLKRNPPRATPFEVVSYDANVSLNLKEDRIKSASTVTIQSATDSLGEARFLLNRGLQIQELRGPDGPLLYTADVHIISVTLPRPLGMGERFQVRFEAEGRIYSDRWRLQQLRPAFGTLRFEDWWYPVQYIPWLYIPDYERSRTLSIGEPNLFDATVTVTLPRGIVCVFAGERVGLDESGGLRRETFRTTHPLSEMNLLWGKYEYIDATFAGIPCRFFYLPGHRYQAQVFLEEMKDSQAAVRERLGPLPFPRLTLYEQPMHRYGQGSEMAGLFEVGEGELVYLHEGIWTLDRYDTKPSEVDFYARLPGVVAVLNWRYRHFLVGAYFDKTFHAVGPYSFWLDKYLSSYVAKLLEPNAWTRRYLFRYDSGSLPNTSPSVVARPLLECWKEGLTKAADLRGEGIFRMLHHLLGDDGWWVLIRKLLEEYRFKDVSDRDVIRLVNEVSQEPLDWFFEEWLYGKALPKYEITLAEATLVEKPRSIQLEYSLRIRVKNHGTGRMAVPVYIETDRDEILRDLWLDSGEEKTLTLVVPHRPIFAMIDPQNWVLQEPYGEKGSKRYGHSERKFDILQPSERMEGGKRLAVSPEGNRSR